MLRGACWCVLLIAAAGAAANGGAGAPPRTELVDYRGKGALKIEVNGLNLPILFEQVYRKPDTMLVGVELLGIRSSYLVERNVERSFSPQQQMIIEKRFRNLPRAAAHPSLAVQLSAVTFAELIKAIPMPQVLGEETQLDFPCRVIELPNRALLQQLRGLSPEIERQLGDGKTRVWLTQAHDLPIKIEIYDSQNKPAILFAFTELAVNTGLKPTDVRLPAPPNALTISVDVDLSDPKWEEKMERAIQEQMQRQLQGTRPPRRNPR